MDTIPFEETRQRMPDSAHVALTKHMGELADLTAEWARMWSLASKERESFRNRLAALCNRWGADAVYMADIEGDMNKQFAEIQRAMRGEYRREYGPE